MIAHRTQDEIRSLLDRQVGQSGGGAGFVAIQHGEVIAEAYAGQQGTGSDGETLPWGHDTIIGLASSTKALTAATLLLLIDQGQIDLDAPVAQYWPHFAAQGKGRATVRELLGHRVGVVTTPRPFSTQDQYDQHPITEALASAEPDWEPGSRHGYHAYTFGWLVSGLLQAVTGRSVFELFSDEIATPYALDLTLALPARDQHRVATVAPPDGTGVPQVDPAYADMNAAMSDPMSLLYRATFGATSVRFEDANNPWVISAPDPSGGGHGSAAGLARFYAALVTGLDGRPPILSSGLMDEARRPVSEGMDAVLRLPTRWGLGFMLPGQPMWTEGPTQGFGHAGASGSIGFADPERGLCVGYTPSAWTGLSTGTDERAETLIRVLYAGLTD